MEWKEERGELDSRIGEKEREKSNEGISSILSVHFMVSILEFPLLAQP